MSVEDLIRRLQAERPQAQVEVRPGDSSYAALLVDGREVLRAVDDSGWGR